MNGLIKRRNKEKQVFFNRCRKQFLRLNKGLDHTRKWNMYQRVKGHIKMPELYHRLTSNKLPDISQLPERFCVKGNLGEQGQQILLIKKLDNGFFRDCFHKRRYCANALKRKIRNMLNFSKVVIFEQWLYDPKQGNIPFDYKIHIINGQVLSMFVFDRNGKTKYLTVLDKNWEMIPLKDIFVKPIPGYSFNDPKAPQFVPESAEDRQKLIDAALNLWEVFNKPHFTRFDMYLIDGEVYFGEATVICGGMNIGTMRPQFIDKLIADCPW